MGPASKVLVAMTAVLALAACSKSDDGPAKVEFDVPGGGQITQPGTELKYGATALVAFPEGKPTAALSLQVKSVAPAGPGDLEMYSVPDDKDAYYVQVVIGNRGPAAVDSGESLPWWLRVSGNTQVPPSTAPARFKPCRAPKLTSVIPAGASAEGCLLFLVPAKSFVKSVDFQPNEEATAVRWLP